MFMEEELATSNLATVERTNKPEVQAALLELLTNSVSIHLLEVDSVIPDGERCTRRGSDHPIRVGLIDESAGELPIGALAKVPGSAIGLK